MLAEDEQERRVMHANDQYIHLLNNAAAPIKNAREQLLKQYRDRIHALLEDGTARVSQVETIIDVLARVRNDPFIGPIINRVESKEREEFLAKQRESASPEGGGIRPEDIARMRRIGTARRGK